MKLSLILGFSIGICQWNWMGSICKWLLGFLSYFIYFFSHWAAKSTTFNKDLTGLRCFQLIKLSHWGTTVKLLGLRGLMQYPTRWLAFQWRFDVKSCWRCWIKVLFWANLDPLVEERTSQEPGVMGWRVNGSDSGVESHHLSKLDVVFLF